LQEAAPILDLDGAGGVEMKKRIERGSLEARGD